jgi:hypothetical protein
MRINAETLAGTLILDGHYIVGYSNNRDGRRQYERDVRKGRGAIRIAVTPFLAPSHKDDDMSVLENEGTTLYCDYRDQAPTVCPFCGSEPLLYEERTETFILSEDETWSIWMRPDAEEIIVAWNHWTGLCGHSGPDRNDIPAFVSAYMNS